MRVLSGMNIYAAIFLIPFSVVLYTSTGGLKVGSSAGSLVSKQCNVTLRLVCKLAKLEGQKNRLFPVYPVIQFPT